MILTRLYNEFFKSERTGGFVLISVTILSLFLANSPWQRIYVEFWQIDLGGHTIVHWINDGLMTLFFLMIGLELEREIYKGELSDRRNAALPLFSALGGMLVPAAIYLLINSGTGMQAGAGIPMATDIAFAIGILSLLGNRVPASLKIFLTALAVIDDLGAIIIIAVFYSAGISLVNLSIALIVFGLLLILNRLRVRNLIPYLVAGMVMWYFMSLSGVHATITGVLLAFAIPFGDGGKKSPSHILQHLLHKPVAFFILPLFALANTCIPITEGWLNGLGESGSTGVMTGLIIGKPLGICLFSFLGVITGVCMLPSDLKWRHIIGAGFLGGIGFTMSVFITLLAFDDEPIINNVKFAIIIASVIAGLTGFIILRLTLKQGVAKELYG